MRVHLIVEHALELEPAHVCLKGLSIRFYGTSGGLVIFGFRQLEQLSGVCNALTCPVDLFYCRGEPCALATELLRPLLVRPDGGIFELAPYLLEPLFLLVVLKETPSRRSCAPPGL